MKYLILYVSLAAAQLHEEAINRQVITAKTAKTLLDKALLGAQLQKVQDECESDLREKNLPDSCYVLLELETKLGFFNKIERDRRLLSLNEKCKRAASSGNYTEINHSSSLSPECASYVRIANCKKAYQDGLIGFESFACFDGKRIAF